MITLDNYEGWLMRYADDALTPAERREVERFLAAHPGLAEEMEEVASVKVSPVLATLPDKERLLRREPVVLWRRVAAAVALLVVAGTTLLFLNRADETPLVAQAEVPEVPAVQPDPVVAQPVQAAPVAVQPRRVRPAAAAEVPEAMAEAIATPAPDTLPDARPEPLLLASEASEPDAVQPASPSPAASEPRVIVGLVVDGARLAVNPWHELLALND